MLNALNILKKVSLFVGLSERDLVATVNYFSRLYKIYTIEKASGGKRKIYHPAKQLKMIQYALYELLLKQFTANDIAYAYIPGLISPLRKHATIHSRYPYTIRIDIKDFFPSIKPKDLIRAIKKKYSITKDDLDFLNKSIFYYTKADDSYSLPIGAPTSPCVSNIVMSSLDIKMNGTSKLIDPHCSISRYADDIYFSTEKRWACESFLREAENIFSKTKTPKLRINRKKTLFLSRGTRRCVTGLFITPDGNVSIGRERKKERKKLSI